jgi:hypothetical protein
MYLIACACQVISRFFGPLSGFLAVASVLNQSSAPVFRGPQAAGSAARPALGQPAHSPRFARSLPAVPRTAGSPLCARLGAARPPGCPLTSHGEPIRHRFPGGLGLTGEFGAL